MSSRKTAFALSASALLMGLPMLASANEDRAPTAEERSAIEAQLTAAGYESWEEIEFDDGRWEVDDARKAGEAQEYDLKLAPDTYEITSTRKDD